MKRYLAMMVILLSLLGCLGSASAVEYDTMYTEKNELLPIPKTYTHSRTIAVLNDGQDMLSEPSDLCVAPDGHIYVADTGNNRIVELDETYAFVRAMDQAGEQSFRQPQGVFVDEWGGIYVADTGNERIVKLSAAGEYVESFVKPESELLGEGYTFTPRRIAVSSVGYLYTIKFQNLMQIDAYNRFRGYIGTNQVGFDLGRQIRLLFSNDVQRKTMKRQQPYSVYSYALSPDGAIYITTPDPKGQLKKINSVGNNIYPYKGYFGQMVRQMTDSKDGLAQYVNPQYLDVAVDGDEIIFMLEGITGQICIYDAFGNNLGCFGGKYEGEDGFLQPSAVDVTAARDIIVADQGASCLKVFSPTRFMNNVFDAAILYGQGRYQQAQEYWQEILQYHESYYLANAGMAKALYKQGEYGQAMHYYQICGDRSGYSDAYAKWRHDIFRTHFPQVVLAIAAALLALIILLKVYGRYVRRTLARYGSMI